jgi:hypothetical protein
MGELVAIVIPCKTFKERIRLTKQHIGEYYIENMDNYLYMVKRKRIDEYMRRE